MVTKTNRIHYVYKTVNLMSGQEYIGVHSTYEINDKYLGSGVLLKKDIKQYGKKSFKREILQLFDSRESAFIKEKQLVCKEYVNNGKTYNRVQGGGGNNLNIVFFIPKNYQYPSYNKDITSQLEFYIDSNLLCEFKKDINVDMSINTRDLTVLRKQFSQLVLNDIDTLCQTLTNYYNDQRFHEYSKNALCLLFQLGFNKIIKARCISDDN